MNLHSTGNRCTHLKHYKNTVFGAVSDFHVFSNLTTENILSN